MENERWQNQAACKDVDPDLFFPEDNYRGRNPAVRAAKAVCRGCPLRADCLAGAMERVERHGIWGGTTPLERVSLGMPKANEVEEYGDWVAELRGCGSLPGVLAHEQAGTDPCRACAYALRQSIEKIKEVSDVA